MNYNRLKGKLVEQSKTYEDCAKALNISITTFSKKINGQAKFYVDEVMLLSDLLSLNKTEKIDIFLS